MYLENADMTCTRGVSRNMDSGGGGGEGVGSHPFPPLGFPPLPILSFPLYILPSPALTLEVGPLNPVRGNAVSSPNALVYVDNNGRSSRTCAVS